MHGLRSVAVAAALLSVVGLAGCFSSSNSGSSTSTRRAAGSGENGGVSGGFELSETAVEAAKRYDELAEKYPDVPRVELTTELDGVKIRRFAPKGVDFSVQGEVPADVGNDYARENPAEPVTGGRITVRFNAEPKTLNPITETSAYQSYIQQYTHDALAELNPETLEYEPKLAERWVIEDSVRLAADCPGWERQVAVEGGTPAATATLTYPDSPANAEPPVIRLKTFDGAGEPVAGAWVRFLPQGVADDDPMAGGLVKWSDTSGTVELSGVPAGAYDVSVGADVYGMATIADDGTLTLKAETEENPVSQQEGGELTFEKGQYVDVQRGTVFTYYLRPDAKWADGEPFTAEDLEFGYAVINNPDVDGDSIRVYYSDLVECTPLAPTVVRMKYREQYFLAFEFTYGLAAFSPPKHLFQKWIQEGGRELTLERLSAEEERQQKKVSVHGAEFARLFNDESRYNDGPMGTGPYEVVRWNRSDSLLLKRRNDYWDSEGGGYLDEILVKFIPDSTTALQELRAGNLDFLWMMTAEQYFEDLKGPPEWFKKRYVKAEWFSPGYSYVGWNMLQEKFADRRVRMALALLFNTEEWIEKKLYGGAVGVSGSQYIFGKGYDDSVMPVGYDPDAARELLQKAGWIDSDGDGVLDRNGKPFRFTLSVPSGNDSVRDQMAMLQKELKQVGIQMDIRDMEWAAYLEKIHNKDFDVCRMSWAQSLESDPFQLWHSSGAGASKRSSNHVSFSNPEADRLIEMLRVTLDEEKRKLIHASFHRLLDREQPYMFLYTPKDFGAYDRRIRGVKWYPIRPGYDLREWYLAKEDQ